MYRIDTSLFIATKTKQSLVIEYKYGNIAQGNTHHNIIQNE